MRGLHHHIAMHIITFYSEYHVAMRYDLQLRSLLLLLLQKIIMNERVLLLGVVAYIPPYMLLLLAKLGWLLLIQ